MRKISFSIVICIIVLQSMLAFPVSALTPKEEKGVKTLKSDRLARESPDWFTPFTIEEAPLDLEYWMQLLEDEKDHAAAMYVVMPTLGLITPVIMVPEGTKDYKEMTGGKEIDINKYLNDGVMHYPGTGMPGDVGNPVIFGHSNFFKHGEGRYKTIFADIMNLDVGFEDEIWVFTKVDLNAPVNKLLPLEEQYEKRRFRIEQSYETVPTDVGILRPQGGKELTVFACTNGLEGRWILRARLIEDNEVLVPIPMRARFLRAVEQLNALPEERQRVVRQVFLNKATEVKDGVTGTTYGDKFKKYLVNYFMREVDQ